MFFFQENFFEVGKSLLINKTLTLHGMYSVNIVLYFSISITTITFLKSLTFTTEV